MTDSSLAILLIEDDERLSRRLADGLGEAGYRVTSVGTAREARREMANDPPALVLLDLGLPDRDGFDLLVELRGRHPHLPVIVTTARDKVSDRVRGLDVGADDYLVKPYAFEELRARIRTQLRHSERASLRRTVGSLELDLQNRTATRNGHVLNLTPREFDLLAYLASLNGEVASRESIQHEVWKVRSRMTSMDNVIDVHVSRLRQKLGEAGEAAMIHTVRGVGIALREDP